VTPTEHAANSLPAHLRRYVVDQDWDAYTPREHAVWRHVLRRLVAQLGDRAHESYLRGLAATGIGTERIPHLDGMNERLGAVGWSAVGVRGFIPPAVFTELQSRRVLAIAADIRSHEHVEYTPAPDIIHESAGHAPILADARYAGYLRRCGEVGFKAIASVADDAVFQAVRQLSIVKEDPEATPEEIRLAGERLGAESASRRHPSESIRASRLYWWTAEYGLVGSMDRPRIYGAGLLSSLGESARCTGPEVRREPLTAACADAEYDITEMQPRLFVTPDFDALFDVLETFSAGLSFRVGGDHGLAEALHAGTVNHLVLSSGLEVSGRVSRLVQGDRDAGPGLSTALVRIEGPVQLSRKGVAEGRPLDGPALVALGSEDPIPPGRFRIELPSGLSLAGFSIDGREVLDLRAWMGERPLEIPASGLLLLARTVPSVAGGPADPGAWDRSFGAMAGLAEGDGEARARARKATALPARLASLYADVRALRESGRLDPGELDRLRAAAERFPEEWLLQGEIGELARVGPVRTGASAPPPR
jgi:phenylalanine-4-hydroxylase